MTSDCVRRWGVGATLTGAVVVAAVLGMGAAHADNGADEINGWTVTPTNDITNGSPLPPATLSDPSDSLGLGTTPIVGGFASVPATSASDFGANDQFITPVSTLLTPDFLLINDTRELGGFELATVDPGPFDTTNALLVSSPDGKELIDLFNFGFGTPPPLFNPDATGPIDIGGVELASPQDGALLNDVFDAIFTGDTADWGKAETLFDDLLGIDPSGAADAVDPSSLIG